MAAETRSFNATIARVNGSGFQTREDPGRWVNLSKYATTVPTIPPIGTECQITVDGAGFVRAIEPVGPAEGQGPTSVPTSGTSPQARTGLSKDTAIVRMNALKTAARLMGPDADTEAVLGLAGRLEAWITR